MEKTKIALEVENKVNQACHEDNSAHWKSRLEDLENKLHQANRENADLQQLVSTLKRENQRVLRECEEKDKEKAVLEKEIRLRRERETRVTRRECNDDSFEDHDNGYIRKREETNDGKRTPSTANGDVNTSHGVQRITSHYITLH
jgi:hypothetical protein